MTVINWQDISHYPTSLTKRHYVVHRNGIPTGVHTLSEHCQCKPQKTLSGDFYHTPTMDDIRADTLRGK